MGIDAGAGNLIGNVGKSLVPHHVRAAVVRAVHIVVVNDDILIRNHRGSRSRRNWRDFGSGRRGWRRSGGGGGRRRGRGRGGRRDRRSRDRGGGRGWSLGLSRSRGGRVGDCGEGLGGAFDVGNTVVIVHIVLGTGGDGDPDVGSLGDGDDKGLRQGCADSRKGGDHEGGTHIDSGQETGSRISVEHWKTEEA